MRIPRRMARHEIQLQLIEKGRSKRVRRQLLSKHTLTEALDLARVQEVADKHARKIQRRQQNDGSIGEEINKVSTQRPYKPWFTR